VMVGFPKVDEKDTIRNESHDKELKMGKELWKKILQKKNPSRV